MKKPTKKSKETIAKLKAQLDDVSNKLAGEQEKSRQLEHIIASMPGHIYWMDKDGRILGCNDEQARNVGFSSRLDMIGKTIHDFQPKEKADKILANNNEIMSLGLSKVIEETGNLVDGNEKTFLSHKAPLRDEKNNIIGVLGISTDITAHKNNEFTLENIIALMPGHVYWQNKDGVILGCNDEQAKNLGLKSRSYIVGKTIYDLQPKEQANHLQIINYKVIQTGEAQIAEEVSTLANGQTKTFLSQKVPLQSKNGDVIGLVGISVDITARKEMEEALRFAKERAEITNNIKSAFIKNMQHDIRTPLSGLWGMADILERKIKDTTLSDYINNIKLCTTELLNFCDSILDFTNIEHGNQLLLFRKFDNRALIMKIASLEEPAAKSKGLNLILDYPKAVPEILIGDEFRIYRILLNLVSNAIKFTEKGYVKVSVKKLKSDKEKREIIFQFVIKDTGIGIPKDKQTYIFEKFSRLSPSNRVKYKGLGLGLRIVKEFVNDLNGDIKVSSKVKVGSAFICTIPFKLP